MITLFTDTDEDYQIVTLEIMYNAETTGRSIHENYKVERVHDKYYTSTGSPVDSHLMNELVDSFTDFYESERHEICEKGAGFSEHYTVKATLKNGETMIMKSDSSCRCSIPWNITYKGEPYVQYNGKIPTALLKILLVLDSDRWSYYEKDAHWGCYPGEIPDVYVEKGFSSDFPESTVEKSPEELLGAQHVLWKVDVLAAFPPQYTDGIFIVTAEDAVHVYNKAGEKLWEMNVDTIIMPPQYAEGILYITVNGAVHAVNSQTGQPLWEYTFEKGPFCSKTGIYLAAHDGAVYVGTPAPAFYKLDAATGAIIWEYKGELRTCPQVKIFHGNLLMHSAQIFCLDTETGGINWEIPFYAPGVAYYEDMLLTNGVDEAGYFFYALIDSGSGEVLWRENSRNIGKVAYNKGIMYIDWIREMRVSAVTVETGEERWSHEHEKTVVYQTPAGEGVFFLIADEKEKVLETLVHVTNDGSLWEYSFESVFWDANYKARLELIQDTAVLVREGGFIEGFDINTGNKLWETEVRGSKIESVHGYGGGLYVSADDSIIYCVDVTSGDILWMVSVVPAGEVVSISEIGDGIILVDSESSVYVLSID